MTQTTATPAPRRQRTCEELGICQGRYPKCGRCDDEHPEDEASNSPWSEFWFWLWVMAATGLFIGVCIGVYWWATS